MNKKQFIKEISKTFNIPKSKAADLYNAIQDYSNEASPFPEVKLKGAAAAMVNNLSDEIAVRFIDFFKTISGDTPNIGVLRKKTKKGTRLVLTLLADKAIKEMTP
jgi:hypothetical protein